MFFFLQATVLEKGNETAESEGNKASFEDYGGKGACGARLGTYLK